MAKKPFEFMVDTIFENPHSVATVKQLDCATFNITITENGFEKNLSNQTIIFYARKPDGKLVMQEEGITVTNATAGKLTIEVKNSVFQAVGYVVAELDIRGNDGEISTTNFIFRVSEKVGSNEAVHSEVDVNLFKEIAEYIHVCVEEITKYKTLFESFCEAGVSLEGLNDIKAYIDNNLAGLKAESKKAEQMIPKVTTAINQAEAKKQEVETVTARAEDKRQEVQNLIDSNEVVVQEDLKSKVSKAGDSMSGNLTFNTGCPIVMSTDGADVRLDFAEGEQARIRIGGNGAGTSNGFEIQGQGNRKLLRIDNTGQIFAGGTNKVYHAGNKPTASEVGALPLAGGTMTGNLQMNENHIGLSSAYPSAKIGIEPSTQDVYIGNSNGNWLRVKPDKTLTIAGKKVYTEIEKPTASEVGAIAKADYEVGANGVVKDISGQDVRAINKSGRYRGQDCINAPTVDNHWYYYDIEVHSSTWKKITAKAYGNSKTFVCTQNSGTWSGWNQLYSTEHKPTPADIGALPLTGGTMTGQIISPSVITTGYRTADTGGTSNQWFKMATLTITKQYSDVTAFIDYMGHSSADGSLISGRIEVMLKQQAPLGQAPVHTIYITNAVRPTAVEVRLIVTATTTTKTEAQVWMKIGITYTGMCFSIPSCSVNSTASITPNTNPVFASLPSGNSRVATCNQDNFYGVRQVRKTTLNGTQNRVTITPPKVNYTNYKVTLYCNNKMQYSNLNIDVNGSRLTYWCVGSTFSLALDFTKTTSGIFVAESTVKCQYRKDSGGASPDSHIKTISASAINNIVIEPANGSGHGMETVTIIEEWC